MAWWLQVVLAIVLVVLCGVLVPLLLQLRRTAAAVQGLAESARADLGQITADVHHLRIRADDLVDMAAASLEGPVSLGRFTAGAVGAVEALLGKGGLGWLSPVLSGLKLVVNFLRRPKKGAASKEDTHE
jgi:hypothetical protein